MFVARGVKFQLKLCFLPMPVDQGFVFCPEEDVNYVTTAPGILFVPRRIDPKPYKQKKPLVLAPAFGLSCCATETPQLRGALKEIAATSVAQPSPGRASDVQKVNGSNKNQ